MSYNPVNPNGQAAMAASSPVVLPSDQSPVPFRLFGGIPFNYAQVNATGALVTTTDPTPLLSESFDGSTLDTVNRWNAPVVAGAGALVQNGGSATFSVGTAALSAVALSSIPTFATGASSQLTLGFGIKFENPTIATGSHRFFGYGTPGTAFSATNPIKDGMGFEITSAGVLRAVMYSNDVLVFSQNLTIPVDNNQHVYLVVPRGNVILWFVDAYEIPSASLSMTLPNNSQLPLRVHIVNGASTTTGTPSIVLGAIGNVDVSRGAVGISDGTYAFQKAKVDKYGNLSVVNTPYAALANLIQGTTAAITGTTATQVLAAAGAGISNYVTAMTIANSHASNGTVVEIRDGTTTVIWRGYVGPQGNLNVDTVLKGSANTGIYAACLSNNTNTYVTATGFKA